MTSTYPLYPLREVADLQNGHPFSSKDWQPTGIPVVKIANVRDGLIDLTGCAYVSPAKAQEQSSVALQGGDILIGMTGYVGSVGMLRADQTPCMLNQRVGRFVNKHPGRLDWTYLYFVLRHPEIKAHWDQVAHGSAQKNLSKPQILDVPIPLPPLDEQRRIAGVLGALDDKITANRRMNATLDGLTHLLLPKLLSGEVSVGDVDIDVKD